MCRCGMRQGCRADRMRYSLPRQAAEISSSSSAAPSDLSHHVLEADSPAWLVSCVSLGAVRGKSAVLGPRVNTFVAMDSISTWLALRLLPFHSGAEHDLDLVVDDEPATHY